MKRITQPTFFAKDHGGNLLFAYLCFRAMGRSHAEVKAYKDSVIKKYSTEVTGTNYHKEVAS